MRQRQPARMEIKLIRNEVTDRIPNISKLDEPERHVGYR